MSHGGEGNFGSGNLIGFASDSIATGWGNSDGSSQPESPGVIQQQQRQQHSTTVPVGATSPTPPVATLPPIGSLATTANPPPAAPPQPQPQPRSNVSPSGETDQSLLERAASPSSGIGQSVVPPPVQQQQQQQQRPVSSNGDLLIIGGQGTTAGQLVRNGNGLAGAARQVNGAVGSGGAGVGAAAAATGGSGENGGRRDILYIGYRFKQLDLPEDTWAAIWKEVKDALAVRGHTAVNIRSIHKLENHDTKSRWKRQQLVCKCSGLGRSKLANEADRKRKSHSNKTNCPFKVTVSWPKTGPPNITQLDLTHNEACNVDKRKVFHDAMIPIDVLHKECYEDVKQWTIAGLRKADMFRLLHERFAPLKLGEEGRRKVRNMCIKVDRELSAIVEDFSGNWEAGEAAEVLQDRAAAVAARRHGYHENPVNDDTALAPLREKLLGNLKGIAGREASRLVANLSVRLTPEMAMAVFQNLTLQVDALISGSGVVAGPMRVAAEPGGVSKLSHMTMPPPPNISGTPPLVAAAASSVASAAAAAAARRMHCPPLPPGLSPLQKPPPISSSSSSSSAAATTTTTTITTARASAAAAALHLPSASGGQLFSTVPAAAPHASSSLSGISAAGSGGGAGAIGGGCDGSKEATAKRARIAAAPRL